MPTGDSYSLGLGVKFAGKDAIKGSKEFADSFFELDAAIKAFEESVKSNLVITNAAGEAMESVAESIVKGRDAFRDVGNNMNALKKVFRDFDFILKKQLMAGLKISAEQANALAQGLKNIGAAAVGAFIGGVKMYVDKTKEGLNLFTEWQDAFVKLGTASGISYGEVATAVMDTMRGVNISFEEARGNLQELWETEGWQGAINMMDRASKMAKVYGVNIQAQMEGHSALIRLIGGTEKSFKMLEGQAMATMDKMKLPPSFLKNMIEMIPALGELAGQLGRGAEFVTKLSRQMMSMSIAIQKNFKMAFKEASKVVLDLMTKLTGFRSQFERFRLGLTESIPEEEMLKLARGVKDVGMAYKLMTMDAKDVPAQLAKIAQGMEGNEDDLKRLYYSVQDVFGTEIAEMMRKSAKEGVDWGAALEAPQEGTELLSKKMKQLNSSVKELELRNELQGQVNLFKQGEMAASAYTKQLNMTYDVLKKMEQTVLNNSTFLGKLNEKLAGFAATYLGFMQNPYMQVIMGIGIPALISSILNTVISALINPASIAKILSPMVPGVAAALPWVLTAIGGLLAGALIGTGLDWVMSAIIKALTGGEAKNLGELVYDVLFGGWDSKGKFHKGAIGLITDVFKSIGNAIASLGKWLWEIITWPFTKAWDFLFGHTVWSRETILDAFTEVLDAVIEIGKKILEAITLPFTKAFDVVKNVFKESVFGKTLGLAEKMLEKALGIEPGTTEYGAPAPGHVSMPVAPTLKRPSLTEATPAEREQLQQLFQIGEILTTLIATIKAGVTNITASIGDQKFILEINGEEFKRAFKAINSQEAALNGIH